MLRWLLLLLLKNKESRGMLLLLLLVLQHGLSLHPGRVLLLLLLAGDVCLQVGGLEGELHLRVKLQLVEAHGRAHGRGGGGGLVPVRDGHGVVAPRMHEGEGGGSELTLSSSVAHAVISPLCSCCLSHEELMLVLALEGGVDAGCN